MATNTSTKRGRRASSSKQNPRPERMEGSLKGLTKTCISCGRELPLSRNFYHTNSPLFIEDEHMNICKDCFLNSILTPEGKIDNDKLLDITRLTDTPLYWDILDSSKREVLRNNPYMTEEMVPTSGKEILKAYMKNVNSLHQLKYKTFAASEADGHIFNHEKSVQTDASKPLKDYTVDDVLYPVQQEEVKWSKKDKQNMRYAISMVGYDPFEDVGLSEADRKYCFNILAGYCDMDGVVEDGHKLQGVIEMTMLYCQCRKISEVINIALNSPTVDQGTISKFSSAKSTLLSSISTIAKDNNIASNYSKDNKQGQNTLSAKMREMQEKGMHDADVNLFDIKTAEAFKQVDAISLDNISRQLTLDAGDYSEMLKEQTEMITELADENDALKEENRQLQNQILELEANKR